MDADPKGKSEAEKKEIEAAAEGSEPEQAGALKEGETLPSITLKYVCSTANDRREVFPR